MSFFYVSNSLKSSNSTGYYDYKDEHTYHLVCFHSSYYSNAYAVFYRMGVCCNNPLSGRKGVRKMSYSEKYKEHIKLVCFKTSLSVFLIYNINV